MKEPEAHTHPAPAALDIREPAKWQMAIRLHLEKLTLREAEEWMDGMRLITQVASRLVRDRVYARATEYCCVCKKPLRDGRPAGTVGYYEADRTYIPLSYCDPSEIGEAMHLCKQKEDAVRAAQERSDKAARQAMVDARQRQARLDSE